MNAKTITSTLACLILGSLIAVTGCGQSSGEDSSGKDGNDKDESAREKVEKQRKAKLAALTKKNNKLENDNRVLREQLKNEKTKAQMTRVKPLNSPKDIIKELPGLYGSNDSAFQRRRIHLTESLVDHQEGSLDAIEEFLNSSQDTEPDIAADSHRRMLDRYGITEEQYVSLQNSIKETLEVMKPALDADKERRDAERAKRREEDEKRREEGRARFEDFRPKMEAFRATLEDLPEDERGQKMREWFQEQRNNPESVARREQEEKDREARREQEKNDRETRGPTASDELRAKVEANTKVVLGAEQFEAMQNDRSLGRLISEIGGSDFRDAVGGGGREDWRSRFGGGRGGDQGRGRGGR